MRPLTIMWNVCGLQTCFSEDCDMFEWRLERIKKKNPNDIKWWFYHLICWTHLHGSLLQKLNFLHLMLRFSDLSFWNGYDCIQGKIHGFLSVKVGSIWRIIHHHILPGNCFSCQDRKVLCTLKDAFGVKSPLSCVHRNRQANLIILSIPWPLCELCLDGNTKQYYHAVIKLNSVIMP